MRSWLRSWGVSLRLARRGMLRAKGRSLLIIAMIGVPVLALTLAAVTYDSFRLTPEEKMARVMGTADATASWFDDQPLDQSTSADPPPLPTVKTDERLLALLPPGSRVLRYSTGGSVVRAQTATGIGWLSSSFIPVGEPLSDGMIQLVRGSAPKSDGEVAITEAAARRLGADLGATVRLLSPEGTFTVSGIVVIPDDLGEFVVFRPGVQLREESAKFGGYWLVDLPDGVAADVPKLRHAGVGLQLRGEQEVVDPSSDQTFTLATIAIGLTVFEVVLLCGPAFAVGARRRQRELALVAATGGTAQQLRRMTQADGIVLGLTGAVAGIALGVPLALVVRPFVEEYAVHRLAGGFRIYPAALVAAVVLAVFTGLVASLVPAITAARQNVVAALTGRRGMARSRKRWIALGVLLVAAGGAIAVAGGFAIRAELIVAGLVVGQLGLVVVTPSMIGLLGRFGRSLPLTARIALRDTARNRASAAPAISAVMAVVAGSVTIGIYFASLQAQQAAAHRPALPLGYAAVSLQVWADGGAHPMDDTQLAELKRQVASTLPVDRLVTLHTLQCTDRGAAMCQVEPVRPAAENCPYQTLPPAGPARDRALADRRCHRDQVWNSGPLGLAVVDDGSHLADMAGGALADLTAARAALRNGGVVVSDPSYVRDGRVELTVRWADEREEQKVMTLPAYALKKGIPGFGVIIGPEALKSYGFSAQRQILLVATTRPPTTAEMDAFDAAARQVNEGSWSIVELGPRRVELDLGLIVLGLASAIVTLAATAVVTGLTAADGRADLTTLAAVGASPRVRRFMSLSQSGVIAGLGTILGIAAGAGGAYAMIFAINRSTMIRYWPHSSPLPLAMPWLMLAGALIVPVIAMLGAGLLTRSRLPIERRA